MKIAVSSTGAEKNSTVDQHFGRCPYFGLYDSETDSFDAAPNRAQLLSGGAGIQSTQLLVDRGIDTVLTGNVGPKALQALQAAKITVITGVTGVVAKALQKALKGEYDSTDQPTVQSHFGIK